MYDNLSAFTIAEVREIYGDDFPHEYTKIRQTIDFDSIYHSILERRISINEDNFKIKKYTTKQARQLFILDNSNLPFSFASLIDDVLNQLESVCMDISSQAAGENYIYQSLHQTFLRTIKTLSINICLRNNQKYSDKYYTNIIHVYNSWTKMYKDDLNKEKKRQKKARKYLNPKIKTV